MTEFAMPAPKRGPRIRYDADRQAVATRVATTFGRLTLAGHTVSHVREIIKREINDGLKGTAYDGIRVTGGEPMSQQERAILTRADEGHDDLAALDRALGLAQEAEAVLFAVLERRDPLLKRKPGDTDDKRKPGKGKCPPSLCAVCWTHGAETPREGGFALWCDRCGQFKRTYDQRPTNRAVWEILHRRGHVPLPDLRRLWPEIARQVSA